MAKIKLPILKLQSKPDLGKVKLLKAATAVRTARDFAKASVAADEAASALQEVYVFPEDLRGGSLDELLAFMANQGKTAPEVADAAAELLTVEKWDEYDKPKLDLEQQSDLADALEKLGKGSFK